jgi:hypothetical protein
MDEFMKKYSTSLVTEKCKRGIDLPQSEWLSSKEQEITNAGEDARKMELLYTMSGCTAN